MSATARTVKRSDPSTDLRPNRVNLNRSKRERQEMLDDLDEYLLERSETTDVLIRFVLRP